MIYKDLLQSLLYYSVITNSTPLTQYKLFHITPDVMSHKLKA
jgi:hypothetical protein